MVVMLSGFCPVPGTPPPHSPIQSRPPIPSHCCPLRTGAQIYYEVYTPDQNTHKQAGVQTLMYHHGMTGASSQIPEFATALVEVTSWRVVLLDSRGCGKSVCDFPLIATQYTQGTMAQDLVAVANHLGVGRFCVGGQSYGTRVSIYTAMIAKGRVDKVILVVPPAITTTWGAEEQPDDTDAVMAAFAKMREAAEAAPPPAPQPTEAQLLAQAPAWKRACTARKDLPDSLAVREMARAASNALNPGFDTYRLQVVMDARAFPPSADQLAELLADTPVLMVFGGEDGLTWAFLEKEQQLLCPHAQLVNFPLGGHEVTMEQPEEVAAAVGAFLLDADPPNWPLGQRTEYLTEAVEAGKASAAAYAATFEAPKL